MIIALTGNNDYLLKRRLDEIIAGFEKEYGELAVEKFDASEVEAQAVLDAIAGQPFLARRKLVVLRDLSANQEAARQIEQIISSAGEDCDLVIYEPAPDKRSAYYKILQKQTRLEIHAEMDASGLAGWLMSETKNQGGELSHADARYLIERVGTNQVMLANELEKLMVYDSRITKESIDLLTEPSPQSKIFDLLDAAFGGNKTRALKLYDEQRAQRVEPQAILAMVSWQLQLITLAKLAAGKAATVIAADTGQRPYPVNKALGLANKLSFQRLRQMVADALEIDTKSKTSPIDMDEALKTYIVNL